MRRISNTLNGEDVIVFKCSSCAEHLATVDAAVIRSNVGNSEISICLSSSNFGTKISLKKKKKLPENVAKDLDVA